MKQLMTIALSCVLMAGCGDLVADEEALSRAAQKLDSTEEIADDAPTTLPVEEEALTRCGRSTDGAAPESDQQQIDKVVVSCGVCGSYSPVSHILEYFLETNVQLTQSSQLQMTLLSSSTPAGVVASFRGPPRGTIQFKNPVHDVTVSPGSKKTMIVRACIERELLEFNIDIKNQ